MIDGARDTLRWIWNLIVHAPPALKVLYIILFVVIFTLAVAFIPFVSNLSDYFSKASAFAQSLVLLFLFVCTIATVLFAYERGHRVDQLKTEKTNLEQALNASKEKLSAVQKELEEKLKSAQVVNEQLESRWNALAEVESRRNIWKRSPPAVSGTASPSLQNHNTRFLAVINLKGGVGKTTLSANLAACLSLAKAKRVLLVDLDFQGSLSNHTVDPQLVHLQATNGNTVVRLLEAGFDAGSVPRLLTPMFHVPGAKVVLATDELESMDFRLQAEFFVEAQREVRFLFRERLRCAVFQQFDLVVFDCPPRLTTSAVNALVCSDFVLIPTKLDQDSIISVPRTIKWLDELGGVTAARLVGVVANDVSFRAGKPTQADQNNYNYLCEVVAQSQAGNRDYVFQAMIKSDPKIPPVERGVVASVDETRRAFFDEFVAELVRRIDL